MSGRRLWTWAVLCFAATAGARGADMTISGIPYRVGKWDLAGGYGNHRACVRVEERAEAVQVHIPWRRRDPNPEKKAVLVVDALTGKQVKNAVTLAVNQEFGDILFEPTSGPGEYHVYYFPVQPAQGNFPKARYVSPQQTADPGWMTSHGISTAGAGATAAQKLSSARVTAFEAISEFDQFTDMEIIATQAEVAALLEANRDKQFLVFPETHEHSIRMSDNLPYRWAQSGAASVLRIPGQRNEFLSFQLGIFAARSSAENMTVAFEDLKPSVGGAKPIPASAMQCFNLGGVDWAGKAFKKTVSVPQGKVQATWCGVQIPRDAVPGRYSGPVTVGCAGQPAQRIMLELEVAGPVLEDRGDSDPWRFSRLRWLNSTIALDDELIKPFAPVKASGREISCLGRKVALGKNGLPSRIISYFSPSVTRIVKRGTDVLAAPMSLVVEGADGKALEWRAGGMRVVKKAPGAVAWVAESRSGDLLLSCDATMEMDGYLEYHLTLTASKTVEARDIRLEIPMRREAATYLMGMNKEGGARPPRLDWKWNADKHQDSVWVGAVNAGLRCQLKGENYERPLVNIHYHHKKIKMPPAWYNEGKGGFTVAEEGGRVVLRGFSGQRIVEPGTPLHFDFTLLVTPFRPIDTDKQWALRFYHNGGWFDMKDADMKRVAAEGATAVNVHHGNLMHPYINYPFLTVEALRTLAAAAHAEGLKLKVYYTVRELTNHVCELFALRSLGDEVLAHGAGGGHQWYEEHFGGNYIQAWFAAGTYDAAIVTSGMSRWHNYYLEGLDWLVRNVGIDGIYIDDVAYDRTVMKRARKILERGGTGNLIDLHSWNHFNDMAGFANNANLYMESLPYVDRIWLGEGFEYNATPSDYWLVEISGIPYGVMGEMLQGGGNPWRGMVYGMTGRLPWSGDPRPIWKLWDSFGMKGTEMIGYWDPACPVKTNNKEVLATVYRKKGKCLIALASWAKEKTDVRLSFDWKAVGLKEGKARLFAPEVERFQSQALFGPSDSIPVEPGKGWLLILSEE